MRYALLADIHGNLHALRAVLGHLERHHVQGYLIAGDLVGYGAQPNECVETLAALEPTCVAGNHDLIAIERLGDDRCIPLGRESLRWTRQTLRDDVRAYLESLPLQASITGGIVLAHGSLDDPEAYTVDRKQAMPQLQSIGPGGARLLVLGHTHRPWAFGATSGSRPLRRPVQLGSRQPFVLNPGAVGQSRELRARARFAVLDLEQQSATFFAVRYDVEGCRAALRRAGLPPRSCHLRPSPAGIARRSLRRLRDRALAAAGRLPSVPR